MTNKIFRPRCKDCGDYYSKARWDKGYVFCLPCGDDHAKYKAKRYTVAPLNKSNYMFITDVALLKQLNPKRTT